eukprot:scpid111445/ scgid20161/ 
MILKEFTDSAPHGFSVLCMFLFRTIVPQMPPHGFAVLFMIFNEIHRLHPQTAPRVNLLWSSGFRSNPQIARTTYVKLAPHTRTCACSRKSQRGSSAQGRGFTVPGLV